jgi:hypothetical protein
MTRRMTLVVLALVGVMVLVVTISPPDRGVRTPSGSAPSATAAPSLSDPDAFDVTETLSAVPGAEEKTIKAELGDFVEIVVEGDEPASVELSGLRTEPVEAGFPARFEMLAETPGTYPLVVVDERRTIGTLEIR